MELDEDQAGIRAPNVNLPARSWWDTALAWHSHGMGFSRADPSGKPHSGWKHLQDQLGWVVVLLFFGRIAGTVTNDPGSGRKELIHIWKWKHKGFAVLDGWKNINNS